MQDFFDLWLPRVYPGFSTQKFADLLAETRRWRFATQEFQFIVLGCGYLYGVRPVDSVNLVRHVKQQLATQHGSIVANALVDERATRKITTLAKKQGFVIGPQKRLLSEIRKSGPLPDPSSRIAALVIAQWINQQPRRFEAAPWACDLYTTLSGRKLSQETFARYEKIAEAEQITVWRGDHEHRIAAISHLLHLFQSRYGRLQQDGFPRDVAWDEPGVLYPIDFLEPALRATGMEIKRP